ncbi:MAG: InlB B-repeat-containing protein, partial [Firmicutes bacterium]|nr:InlB B-repeat-containing protein [Bacillota bacterium]
MRKFLMLITVLFFVFFIYSCTGSGEISISFEENGGTEVEDITVSTSSTSISFPEPTREGYTFDGWYLDDALTQPFTIASLLTNTTLTLYARWTSVASTITITFEPNGGSAVAAISGVAGSSVTAPTNPTKTGFTFDGWYSDIALTTAYTFTTMPESNITLYAKWTEDIVPTKTISFETNGGSAVTAITEEVGSVVTAPTAPTRMGYSFDGWYSDVALTTSYTFSTMPSDDFTLYAKWTINNYTITFNSNDGSAVANITAAYLTAVTAPTAPTKLGHTFGGWYSDVALTTSYTFSTMPAENITLYAKWTANQYTITFNSNDGSAVASLVAAYLSTVSAPTAPTRMGYTFDGWYSDVALTTAYTFLTMPANDFTLYAKWTPTQYTIVFNENGGTAVTDITQAYLTAVTAPTAP